MQKRVFILLAFFPLANTLNAQDPNKTFHLTGTLEGVSDGMVYLFYTGESNKSIKDSSLVSKGKFSFTGHITEPTRAYLKLKEEKRNELNGAQIFLEPVSMTMHAKLNQFKNADFIGSKSQIEYRTLEELKLPVMKQMQPVLDEYNEANEIYRNALKRKTTEDSLSLLYEKAAAIIKQFAPYEEQMANIYYDFFVKNPNSYVTAYMLQSFVKDWSVDTLQAFYASMNESLKQSSYGRYLAKMVEELRGGSPGSLARDFSVMDINGSKLTLSEFKGNYVLLDFWASWCVPCRKSHPHLKELYARYKDKGIEFIGVSDDDSNPDAWKKAVEKDGLPWRHILRGYVEEKSSKGLTNGTDINNLFGIHSLPTKILIDPAGVIIGRFEGDEKELEEILENMFGK